MTTYMPGIGGAKLSLAAYLQANFHEYVTWFRHEVGATGPWHDELREPVKIISNEPQALNEYPLIAIHGVRTTSIAPVELEPAQQIVYRTLYQLRAFVWVRETEWAATIAARDEYTLMLRRFLLDRPSFDNDRLVVMPQSEDFSDVTPLKGGRYVAGAYIDLNVTAQETLSLTAPGSRSPSGIVETSPLDNEIPTWHVGTTHVLHPAFEEDL